MKNYHIWLLDLDDTLQVGLFSWAAVNVFPEIITQTGIKPERATFEAAYARAQAIYSSGGSNEVVGDEFFRLLGWPVTLTNKMLERFATQYKPALFDDTLTFLEWTKARGDQLYLTTNNKWAEHVCKSLGITGYFTAILLPDDRTIHSKPAPDMWHQLKNSTGLTEESGVVLVGNELTTDGVFAKNCGLDCIIVDRYDRFADMPEHCFRVTSLNEICHQMEQI